MHEIQYNAMHTVQYNTIETIQCNTIEYYAYSTIYYKTIETIRRIQYKQYNTNNTKETIQYIIQYNVILLRCNTVTVHYNTYNIKQNNAKQYNTVVFCCMLSITNMDFTSFLHISSFFYQVNMSPNLSSAHFDGNKHLYEQVIYNTLSVAGVARNVPFSLKGR